MLLALVLAACVAPAAHEWVEITQQHYRKPSQTHTYNPGGTFYPADEETSDDLRHAFYPANEDTRPDVTHHPKDEHHKRPNYEEEIKQNIPNRVYPNHSIAEHNWNNDRPGIIKRVDSIANFKHNITPEFSLEIYGEVTESEPEQVTSGYSNRLKDKEIFSATIERVPNRGSVKRVQLSHTPVKSPSVGNTVSSIRRNDIRPYGSTVTHDFSDEFEIKTEILKNHQTEAITTTNNVKNLFSSTKETPMWNYDRIETSTSEPGIVFPKHPQRQFDNVKKVNNIVRDRGNISKIKNITVLEENQVSSGKQINTNAVKTKLGDTKNEEKIKKETTNIVAKNDKINKIEDIDLEEVTTSTYPRNNTGPKGQKTKPSIDINSKTENNKNNEIKVNTMENVMKFVKVIADTINKNTKRGVNGKVEYLNELKETLLNSIKERIDTTWPDDSTRAARRARSARGHVEFPSSESSLMTISFLTFAVFLIKLVLQVIHTYKNKTMMVAPLVVATAGRALRKLRNVHGTV